MLVIAIIIGCFSYSILSLGFLKFLYPLLVAIVSVGFILVMLYIARNCIKTINLSLLKFDRVEKLYIALTCLILSVNFIGVLGPELGFDALWYHLTIPKIFIEHNGIFFIKNNLFYYSLMPKLGEMLYIPALVVGGNTGPKLVHFFFGILTAVVSYRIARLYLNRQMALLASIIFLSNLVVSWMMITSYIDLIRSFYESLALYFFLRFYKSKQYKDLVVVFLMLGFSLSTKLVSIGSIIVLSALSIPFFFKKGKVNNGIFMLFLPFIVSSPYFIFSYINTGNFFYPLFSNYAPHELALYNLNPIKIISNLTDVFLFSSDPINPFYVVIIPILIGNFRRILKYKALLLYCSLSIVCWYIMSFLGFWHATDKAGSARFLTSYLPGISCLSVLAIESLKDKFIKKVIITIAILIAFVNIAYRSAANFKYINFIIGRQNEEQFLMNNLNFEFGDFYDEGGQIRKIVDKKIVLVRGIHNLFYADFKYTLDGWENAKKASFLLTSDNEVDLSKKPIYQNNKTRVKLFRL